MSHIPSSPEANVEIGVKATLFNPAGELLMIRRASEERNWDIPGGRVDLLQDGQRALRMGREMLHVALQREVEEETGLFIDLDEPNIPFPFDLAKIDQPGQLPVIRITNMGRLLCPGEVRLSGEHTDHGYFDLSEARQLPVHSALAQTLRHPMVEIAAAHPTATLKQVRLLAGTACK